MFLTVDLSKLIDMRAIASGRVVQGVKGKVSSVYIQKQHQP